jgi:long-chain fatty acid transport protein
MKKYLQASLAVILSFCMGSEAYAAGSGFIANEVPSARAAGQGYVGVAGQNDDPTAVYTNPAAMTSLKGTQVTFGAHFENVRPSYQDAAGNETNANMTNVLVPNVSLTQSFMDGKLSAGLSVQSPFGLETHWDPNSPMRYVATNSQLGMVDITPAIAYQVHPKVSIGAGVDYYNMFKAQLDRQVYVDGVNVALGGSPTGASDATSSLQGQAAAWGYHAGIVIQPTEKHAIGITYHSKIDLRVNGNVTIRGMSNEMAAVFGGSDFTTSAYTDVMLPSNVQLGYAYKPNEKWMLEADTAWYHWSSGRDINVRYPSVDATTLQGAFQSILLNVGNPQPLTARDAWSFATGANYKANDKWQFRGGVWYEPWALPESTFTPALMDLTRYGISTGFGYAITENWTIDAAYSAVFMHNRTINNDVHANTTGILPDGTPLPSGIAESNGTYKDFANILAVNFTYRFGNLK